MLTQRQHLEISSDGPKQSSAESSAETEISVIRTEISVGRHYQEMGFRAKSARIFFFKSTTFPPGDILLLINVKYKIPRISRKLVEQKLIFFVSIKHYL